MKKKFQLLFSVFIIIQLLLGTTPSHALSHDYSFSQQTTNKVIPPIILKGPQSLPIVNQKNLAPFYNQKITWIACESGFECSHFIVPIDYSHPRFGTFSLAIARKLSTGASSKAPYLFVNPGGPGVPAIDYLEGSFLDITPEVRAHFNLIAFDERGTGRSNPFHCLTGAGWDQYLSFNPNTTTLAGQNEMLHQFSLLAQGCQKALGKNISHYSTVDAARDMDVLRHIIGEKKLNLLGESYGTYLGSIYSYLFPRLVGKMILDGAVDPNESAVESNLKQAIGFEGDLNDFLTANPKWSEKNISDLINQSESSPLKDSHGRALDANLLTTAIGFTLYEPQSGWPILDDALTQAITFKNPDYFLDLADQYNGRDRFGNYTSENDAMTTILCDDSNDRPSLATLMGYEKKFTQSSPTFGEQILYSPLVCTEWPTPAQTPPFPLKQIPISSPVIVIGSTRDPATPYQSAINLSKILTNSRLLTFDADGHTATGRQNPCINQAVNNYLLKGVLPKVGTICR